MGIEFFGYRAAADILGGVSGAYLNKIKKRIKIIDMIIA
jgi:hypothetical protein